MLHKSFEITIPFVETEDGWRPIIEVVFIKPNSPSPLMLALEFDTGADSICLSSDMEWAFPNLKSQKIYGVGSKRAHQGKITRGEIQLLGRTIECDILFASMRPKTWRQGVLGRECFKPFGFGFWEDARELYVSLTP